MSKADDAVSMFNDGFSCSQSVFSTFAEDLGLDRDTALKIAAGFGGGMGRMGEVCGALSGAFMAIGLKYGSVEKGETDAKKQTYNLVHKAAEEFKSRHGCIHCNDLLGIDIGDYLQHQKAKMAGLFSTKCPNFVSDAADIVEKLMQNIS
ncbi:MAG: C_GCAxxG_C_C family protein [Candidatus Latescibacteria bacterium]|nr:C_GCAxxG_C_C family protein [Candidatus Latescibacterota bacterium]